ncbi:hypothetical protein AA0535_1031 [Asaia krungthepensis NRIC 0535]|uniref:Uncharacterized protein n=1 Tax=Asaia krungthepensis NRIC 0535 TaxID=1307925 RepID=A0ABQ0Q0Y7_9PROT|nr:hypothetical protein AA0535_1031 [Asaia krungthepensis NRIC 0535]
MAPDNLAAHRSLASRPRRSKRRDRVVRGHANENPRHDGHRWIHRGSVGYDGCLTFRNTMTGMTAGDYFMIGFVFAAYAIGPLMAGLLVRRINRSGLFDHPEE